MQFKPDFQSETWRFIESFLCDRRETILNGLASRKTDWETVQVLRGELDLLDSIARMKEAKSVENGEILYD